MPNLNGSLCECSEEDTPGTVCKKKLTVVVNNKRALKGSNPTVTCNYCKIDCKVQIKVLFLINEILVSSLVLLFIDLSKTRNVRSLQYTRFFFLVKIIN